MISQTSAINVPHNLFATLAERGWAQHFIEGEGDDAIISEVGRFADLLGTRTAGRAGALEEVIRPRAHVDAHPRSLSARYGLSALPFHTELSHRPRPCRYILLGCFDPGTPSVATMLIDWHTLAFSPDERHLLEGAPILVRTGRRSFYSTILPPDHAFLRYDPGCIEAVDDRGHGALALVENRLVGGSPQAHHWHRGDILIIDNWRVLHGRSASGQASGRRLARVLLNA